jgi:hypothetical protein
VSLALLEDLQAKGPFAAIFRSPGMGRDTDCWASPECSRDITDEIRPSEGEREAHHTEASPSQGRGDGGSLARGGAG